MELDTLEKGVHRDGRFIELTPFQFRIVKILMAGGQVDAENMARRFGIKVECLYQHMHHLRVALGEPPIIRCRPGWGYTLEKE
jgi:DNA-binding response OmpR family regulator